jgi:hypothetical protein
MVLSNETDEQRERRIKKGLDALAETGTTRFEDFLIFNSLRKYGRAKEGLEDVVSMHSSLIVLHGFMAGFQYVVLAEGNIQNLIEHSEQWLFALEVLGFFMSLTGTFVSIIAMEFRKSIMEEAETTQLKGISSYYYVFKSSYFLAGATGILLVLATNILISDRLPVWVCIVYNVTSFPFCVFLCIFYMVVIRGKRRYADGRHLHRYHDFKLSERKLSSHGGDVNKLSLKEIRDVLSVGFNNEEIQSKLKDELVEILQRAIKEDPTKVGMVEDKSAV